MVPFDSAEELRTPLFKVSLDRPMISRGLLVAFFLTVTISSLLVRDWEAAAIPGLLTAFMLVDMVRLAKVQVRNADFYSEYVLVSGSAIRKSLKYSEITNVTKIKPTVFFIGSRVQFTTKDKPLTIFIQGNPRNKKLKVDLYSWLSGKVKSAQKESSNHEEIGLP